MCNSCSVLIMKRIMISSQSLHLYPHLLFPWCSVKSSLQVLIKRLGFVRLCNEWKLSHSLSYMLHVYNGRVWTAFSDDASNPFIEHNNKYS